LSICDRFIHRRSIMPDKDYDVIIVECPRC
jgi:hypothetical protein